MSKNQEMDATELKQRLAEQQQRNREAFLAEYRQLVAEYQVDFSARPTIADDGRIVAQVVLIDVA